MKKLLYLLTPKDRKRSLLLLIMIIIMALLDAIGVASIMPFIAVLANPDLVQNNPILSAAYIKFGLSDPQHFLLMLGISVFFLLVVSLAFKALTTYAYLRFTLMQEYIIGRRLVEGYLHQPYAWFLSRHSADLGKNILSEVEKVIYHAVIPMMTLFAQGSIAAVLLFLLILIDYQLALIISLSLIVIYTLIFKITRGLVSRAGKGRLDANHGRFTVINEAFGASKEVKVGGLEEVYVRRFSAPAQIYARHLATTQIISQVPRFAIEAVSFGGMLLVILYLMMQSRSFTSVIPVIALYAFAGYRLMPALQQIYGAITQLRFSRPALDALHADLMSLQPFHQNQNQETIKFHNTITLNNVVYQYPNSPRPALHGLNLTIPARSKVAIVGSTGSGKTTTVDLILGLLEPQEGTLEVDGKPITEFNLREWQRVIGYVPQQIYLADDTVAANIAFGQEAKDIDQIAVERAAKIANLHDFIVNNLPKQYQSNVGERGVRLSGGQRQRIGIARALYHNPRVLILDEATSALDNVTERAVMDAMNNIEHKITVIIIAHRLSTIKKCHTIFLLDNGELKGQGTYAELNSTNKIFQKMTGYAL